MTEPTKEMIDQWHVEWINSDFVNEPEWIARRAAAWAREQALKDAEQGVRAAINKRRPWYEFVQEREIYAAIRALKKQDQPKENQDDPQQD